MTDVVDHGAERVAALLLALLPSDKELVGQVLSSFDSHELARITNAATHLGMIAPADLAAQIEIFLEQWAEGPRISGGPEQGRNLIDAVGIVEYEGGQIDSNIREATPPTVWELCADVPVDVLVNWLAAEPAHIRAAWFSLLPSPLASDVLGRCPTEIASEIVGLLPRLSSCSPALYQVIEAHVHDCLQSQLQSSRGGYDRLVGLVSRMNPPEFKDLITSLSERDPDLARHLKESMFDFEDVVKFDLESRRMIVERISPDVLTQSIHGADPELCESFLSALGSRTRRMIENELKSVNKMDQNVVSAARQNVASIVVQLLKDGLIVRPPADGEFV